MKLHWLAWHNLPWIRATRGEWRSALRISLAMCLALTMAYLLQLDEPYWAMTSAAVVSFPGLGGAISKSLGRIAGSLTGALAALLIAGHTLNEPWLFAFFMASWLALCTWIASHYQNNVAYAFSLAGYTAAIIAFSSVNVSDTAELWTITQARVCEVITGILCAGIMLMLLPATSDGSHLMRSLQQMHQRLLQHARLLLQERGETAHLAHEQVISEILTMNLLRIQAFWSHYRYRRQNSVLNYVLHQQLRLTSMLSGLRRMLLNWPDAPDDMQEALAQVLEQLTRPQCDKYCIARILSRVTPPDSGDFRQRAFVTRLHTFCRLWLDVQRWIRLLQHPETGVRFQPPRVPALSREADSVEAAWSALRTFTVIMLGCAFWIVTRWESGAAALTLTAIASVLYASAPSPGGSVLLLLRTLLWLSLFSFLFQYGLMVQINALGGFLAVLFPLLLTLQLFRLQQKKRAALWGQFIVFMGSFIAVTNPPEWDFQRFINDNLAKVCGVLLAWMAFQLLRPGSDMRRSRRYIHAIRYAFLDQLRRRPRLSEYRFESHIYHHIGQLTQSRDAQARLWLLRWGVVLLNCSHIVWQLRQWQPADSALAQLRDQSIQDLHPIMSRRGVQHRALEQTLQALDKQISRPGSEVSGEANTLAGMLWQLRCALAQLQQALPE